MTETERGSVATDSTPSGACGVDDTESKPKGGDGNGERERHSGTTAPPPPMPKLRNKSRQKGDLAYLVGVAEAGSPCAMMASLSSCPGTSYGSSSSTSPMRGTTARGLRSSSARRLPAAFDGLAFLAALVPALPLV